jgi:hypothetical protein
VQATGRKRSVRFCCEETGSSASSFLGEKQPYSALVASLAGVGRVMLLRGKEDCHKRAKEVFRITYQESCCCKMNLAPFRA